MASPVVENLLYQLSTHQRPPSPWAVQQPGLFVPGLRAQAWWDPQEFPWLSMVEDAASEIARECDAMQAQDSWRGYREPSVTENFELASVPLHDRGQWDVVYFDLLGRRFDETHQQCPVTSKVLASIPAETMTKFSRLAAQTHIPSHCGPTNLFLRCHLGLEIPDQCMMRVANETRTWTSGKVLVFDDSFNHEVWNSSRYPRTVLIFYIFHPDLTAEDVSACRQIIPQFIETQAWQVFANLLT